MYIYNEWKELKSFIKSIDPIQERIDYPHEPIPWAFSWAGLKMSEESSKKKSIALKGRVFSKESIKKMSLSAKGRVNSPETRKKMSIAKMGKTHSEETKKKKSIALKGKPWSIKRRLAHELKRKKT
jgi:hypothetical protein